MGGGVVLAEPLEDEFVVQQAVEGPEEEHIEGQVANSLLLKVSTQSLHLPVGPGEMSRAFKLCLKLLWMLFKIYQSSCMLITDVLSPLLHQIVTNMTKVPLYVSEIPYFTNHNNTTE